MSNRILEDTLNDIIENCDTALRLPKSRGGTSELMIAASQLFTNASTLLGAIIEAEQGMFSAQERAQQFLDDSEEAHAAAEGHYPLANLIERIRVGQEDK